jgi:hypothetical protein
MPSDFKKVRNASGRGLMIRARGLRRWYFVYHEEKEQLRMSWPVTGGKSKDDDIEVLMFWNNFQKFVDSEFQFVRHFALAELLKLI